MAGYRSDTNCLSKMNRERGTRRSLPGHGTTVAGATLWKGAPERQSWFEGVRLFPLSLCYADLA